MFIPVGTHGQRIWQVDKDADGNVSKKMLMSVVVGRSFTVLRPNLIRVTISVPVRAFD